MFSPALFMRVYIATGVTDMRKSINGLSILVADQLELDPLSGHLFGVSFLAYLLFVIETAISSRSCTGIVTGSAFGINGWKRIGSSGRKQR